MKFRSLALLPYSKASVPSTAFGEISGGDEFFVAKQVSCGGQATFVLGDDGTVFVSGSGDRGQLGTGPKETSTTQFIRLKTLLKFDHISSGFSSSSALCAQTKQVYVWGSAKNGVLGSVNQNLYQPTPLRNLRSCQARLLSSGGWNTIVCHAKKVENELSDEVENYGARARRRAQRTLTASLPPLTRTLENTELNELRSVVRSQSLKRSAEFELCNESELKKFERTSVSVEASTEGN